MKTFGGMLLLMWTLTLPIIGKQPHVVFLVIETTRASHFGCYGYDKQTTPAIDRMARNGMLFLNAYSTSGWTLPSHASMFTGLYPHKHHATHYSSRINPKAKTLAEKLKKEGYVTAGIVSNPTLDAKFGFSRGFDHYDDFSVMISQQIDDSSVKNLDFASAHLARTSPLMNKLARDWLEQKGKKAEKFFLFLHYFDPHFEYNPPREYLEQFEEGYEGKLHTFQFMGDESVNADMSEDDLNHIKALYDAELRYTDDHLKKIFDAFDAMGLSTNTLWIIMGDHGEEFFEHGGKGHGHSLYDEVLKTPLIIRYDGKVPAGTTNNMPISQVDIMPTILSLLGIQDENAHFEGVNIFEKNIAFTRPLFAETEIRANLHAVLYNGLKYIVSNDNVFRGLFNTRTDPFEKKNLINSSGQQGSLQTLKELLMAYRNNNALDGEDVSEKISNIKLSEETKKALKSLGYLK